MVSLAVGWSTALYKNPLLLLNLWAYKQQKPVGFIFQKVFKVVQYDENWLNGELIFEILNHVFGG